MITSSTNHYFMYVDAYDNAILEFICNERFELKQKKRWSQQDCFFSSFYGTCSDMLDNGVNLSDKQKDIIERQMIVKNVNIPKLKDFLFSFSIPVFIRANGKEKYFEKAQFDDFILLLEKRSDINEQYQAAFESNCHLELFHKNNLQQEVIKNE